LYGALTSASERASRVHEHIKMILFSLDSLEASHICQLLTTFFL